MPQTHKRAVCDLTVADRLALYDHVVGVLGQKEAASSSNDDLYVDLVSKLQKGKIHTLRWRPPRSSQMSEFENTGSDHLHMVFTDYLDCRGTILPIKSSFRSCLYRAVWCLPLVKCVFLCVDDEQNEPKTHLELMAEMRDYKRRRQSYRAKNVHITKKSYTEVLYQLCHVMFSRTWKNTNTQNPIRRAHCPAQRSCFLVHHICPI